MSRRSLDHDQYTSIPDTSDSIYWEIKTQDTLERSRIFVPRDKKLHHELKQQAWKEIQAKIRSPYKDRYKTKD